MLPVVAVALDVLKTRPTPTPVLKGPSKAVPGVPVTLRNCMSTTREPRSVLKVNGRCSSNSKSNPFGDPPPGVAGAVNTPSKTTTSSGPMLFANVVLSDVESVGAPVESVTRIS